MKIKLTREDYMNYLSQMIMSLKLNTMERKRLDLIIPWIQKEIKKFPEPKEK